MLKGWISDLLAMGSETNVVVSYADYEPSNGLSSSFWGLGLVRHMILASNRRGISHMAQPFTEGGIVLIWCEPMINSPT